MRFRTSIIIATLFLTSGLLPHSDGADDPPLLKNPEFANKLEAWSLTVFGAKPSLEFDTKITHGGKQSLHISASEPSDAAVAQDVHLQAGGCYRFSGYVRTRHLDPQGSSVSGTLQVQRRGGNGIIASGISHKGDTEWTKVEVYFEAPADGWTHLVLFFVGFGKGTGNAWFDELRLEAIDFTGCPLKITREPLFAGEINPFQYGQFVEYLCDLIPSMWAEKLYDGSFEGLSPYKMAYLKETDFREKAWYPTGATNRAEFVRDPKDPVGGRYSQKISVADGAPCTVGIAQDGLAIAKDQPCVFSCYLRQTGIQGPVQVRIHREEKDYATCEFQPTGEWKKYTARLAFASYDDNTTISITFLGPGTLWLDSASLMPEKTVGGWRPDVVEAVRALKPGIIRFGGSALDDANLGRFDWRDTLGDPDRRMPFRAWGGLQPARAGLEEIVQFCKSVGAEPLLCVRVSGKTPRDAAEQVEYFNGPADSPMGKLRAKNGHAEPYGVIYWQVGNELGGADYEKRLPAFCEAMKAADPKIKLLSSYPSENVLKQAGRWLDYICPHHYGCADLAGKEQELLNLQKMIARHGGGRPIKVAVTEWNTTGGDWGPRRAMLWTLDNALACSRYHNLLHRHGDIVTIANRSNLCNSFCSGIIQTDRRRLYTTPTYHAQLLYATLAGNRALKIDSPLPPNLGLDVSATLSADGQWFTIFAVNPALHEITRPLDLSAFGNAGQEIEVITLIDTKHAGEPDATNNFAEPKRVMPAESKFTASAAKFDFRFAPLSLTVLRWKVR
ncbi:MAG TPA: alpha-L-arabinofuranosidase C-terminal domain-containing protein [Gemmataceae bacterium]|jgi:alpha-N-arabinofuranosidase|nr:alpha-L-arabinofuranosidase C-terminal domain-containing protein [Gemmataceae bacterium]